MNAVDEAATASHFFGSTDHSGSSRPRRDVLVDLDCACQQRHFEAAFARRANQWRTLKRPRRGGDFDDDGGRALTLRVEEYETLPWQQILSGEAVGASSFCVRKGLGRKAVMAEALMAHRCKCGFTCPLHAALPETVVVDAVGVFHARPRWLGFRSALAECMAEAEAAIEAAVGAAVTPPRPLPLWVLKPSLTNKGEGLHIIASAADAAAAVCSLPEIGQWVLQRYVEDPLLLRASAAAEAPLHKFHLRVYVLAAGALAVHVFRESLVLLAAQPFSRASALDPACRAAHVTNTCVGAAEGADLFDEALHVRSADELAGLLLASGAIDSLAEAEQRVAAIYSRVRDVIAHCFRAVEGRVGLYMPLPAPSFELYGVDFLLDARFNVFLLEFNPSPDVKQTGGRLDGLVGRLIDGVVGIATGEAGETCDAWDCVYVSDRPRVGQISITMSSRHAIIQALACAANC